MSSSLDTDRKKLVLLGQRPGNYFSCVNGLSKSVAPTPLMESTGVLWRPVADRLAGSLELVLVNAEHLKRVPGRKTDVLDAEWLAVLLQHGLLTPSFVPEQPQQDLRDLTRLRIHLLQDHTQLVNRIHKVLQQAGIKLSGVLSNILGASGRAIVQALCEGESDPERLAGLAHKSVAHKRDHAR